MLRIRPIRCGGRRGPASPAHPGCHPPPRSLSASPGRRHRSHRSSRVVPHRSTLLPNAYPLLLICLAPNRSVVSRRDHGLERHCRKSHPGIALLAWSDHARAAEGGPEQCELPRRRGGRQEGCRPGRRGFSVPPCLAHPGSRDQPRRLMRPACRLASFMTSRACWCSNSSTAAPMARPMSATMSRHAPIC